MTDFDAGTPAPAPQKKSSPLLWVFLGCGGCLAVAVGFVLLVTVLTLGATQGAADAAHAHVRQVKDGQVQAAYDATAEAFRQEVPLEAFQQFVGQHPELYAGSDVTLNSRQVNNDQATMQGTTTAADGQTVRVTFTLVKEGDAWRILRVDLGE